MQPTDLKAFYCLYRQATDVPSGTGVVAEVALQASAPAWLRRDVRRIARMASVAAAAGDTARSVADAADRIADRAGDGYLRPMADAPSWISAIRWAIDDLAASPPFGTAPGSTTREQEVGTACARLRGRGYAVEIDALGCRLRESDRQQIVQGADTLAARLGGVEVLDQLFRILCEQQRFHDGVFLLGDVVPPVGRSKSPTLPYGWLLSLGLKHVGPARTLRRPEIAWGNLTAQMTDYAAVVDVERYSNMERVNVGPGDLVPALEEALGWHQLFTFPRYTTQAVLRLAEAMGKVLDEHDRRAFGMDLHRVTAEIRNLLWTTFPDKRALVSRKGAMAAFPLLAAATLARRGVVNEKFQDPFDAGARNQELFTIFHAGDDDCLLLPTCVTAAHAATFLITRIWRTLEQRRAEKVVGQVCEQAVADICRRLPAAHVQKDLKCYIGKEELQIDVLVEEEPDLTVLEVKSKALTRQALSGDMIQYLSDYRTSYLAMLLQLVRRERHLRNGHPALPTAPPDVRVGKVAVSPLSYGPLSDAGLGRNLFIGLANSRLSPSPWVDRAAAGELAKLNPIVRNILSEFERLPVMSDDGRQDLWSEMLGYHWLDVAQLCHLVGRGGLAAELKRRRHFTFSSHDFWTESAYGDRLYGIGSPSGA